MKVKTILSLIGLASVAFASEYTGKCKELNETLMENVKKNLRKYEEVSEFNPLRECKLNEKGEITTMYLVSERNDKEIIETAIGQDSITKLTYLLDNDFYQREPAVFNDFPTNLSEASIQDLTLMYNNEVFDHGTYYAQEREINPDILVYSNQKIKTLTLDHIKITDKLINTITALKGIKKLVIISGEKKTNDEIGSTHDSNVKTISTIKNLTSPKLIYVDDLLLCQDGKCGEDSKEVPKEIMPAPEEGNNESDNESDDDEEVCKASDENKNEKKTTKKKTTQVKKTQDKKTKVKITKVKKIQIKKTRVKKTEVKKTTTSKPKETNAKYRCGKNFNNNKCEEGECCSKYGWCGKTDDHCNIGKGCQSEFGVCDETTKNGESDLYKCGGKYGKCEDGECCSKYGWCGKTDDHCNIDKGCQSEFGVCSETNKKDDAKIASDEDEKSDDEDETTNKKDDAKIASDEDVKSDDEDETTNKKDDAKIASDEDVKSNDDEIEGEDDSEFFVYEYTKGVCKDVNKFLSQYGAELEWCRSKNNELLLSLSIITNSVNQDIIDGISKYQSLKSVTFKNIKNISKDLNFESLKVEDLELNYDAGETTMYFTKNILKTAKNIKGLGIFGFNMSKENLEDIYTLTNLETLLLDACTFDKNVDLTKIKNLEKLTQLSLRTIFISGEGTQTLSTFPDSICHLTKLKVLDMYRNSIATIPECIKNLKDLEKLYMNLNELTSLPKELGELTNLTDIFLIDNKLTTVPAELGNLNKLTTLDLEDNNEISKLPEECGKLTKLQKLVLRYTKINEDNVEKCVPKSLLDLPDLLIYY